MESELQAECQLLKAKHISCEKDEKLPNSELSQSLRDIEDVFSFAELPSIVEHKSAFARVWSKYAKNQLSEGLLFGEASFEAKKSFFTSLVVGTASTIAEDRRSAILAIVYLLEGTFDVRLPEEAHLQDSEKADAHAKEQASRMIENACFLRALGVIPAIFESLKRAIHSWQLYSHTGNNPRRMSNDKPFELDGLEHILGDPMHESSLRSNVNQADENPGEGPIQEISAELSLCLTILNILHNIFMGDTAFAEQLFQLNPPAPVLFLETLSLLKDRDAKGYPIKKLLLLLNKSLSATLGDFNDVHRAKKVVRRLEGLPKKKKRSAGLETKISPLDFQQYLGELNLKYPTFAPLDSGLDSTLDRLAAAALPTPLRDPLSFEVEQKHHEDLGNDLPEAPPRPMARERSFTFNRNTQQQQQEGPVGQNGMSSTLSGGINGVGSSLSGLMISRSGSTLAQQSPKSLLHPSYGTPLPSPTQSPQQPGFSQLQQQQQQQRQQSPLMKGRKQQHQTDQARPFILPFSSVNEGGASVVPKSIAEASKLYAENLEISTEVWQTCKVREEAFADESGISNANLLSRRSRAASHAAATAVGDIAASDSNNAPDSLFCELDTDSAAQRPSAVGDIARNEELRNLHARARQAAARAITQVEDKDKAFDFLQEYTGNMRKIDARLNSDKSLSSEKVRRLKQTRLDLERLSRVEVLYRFSLPYLQDAVIVLLKMLLATITTPVISLSEANDPHLYMGTIDVCRRKEITAKAVSSAILSLLKWFKTSHVFKFHYFSQLLIDSNVLLLILKLLNVRDLFGSTDYNLRAFCFFTFCSHLSLIDRTPSPSDSPISLTESVAMRQRNPHSFGSHVTSPTLAEDESSDNFSTYSHQQNFNSDDVAEDDSPYAPRSAEVITNFLHIMQKLTKSRKNRIHLLFQYKSTNILKQLLRPSAPLPLKYYGLKVIKSQVPFGGRKWRQSNIGLITAIYLTLKPDLREEWLCPADADLDLDHAFASEAALRQLTRFFNSKHYSDYLSHPLHTLHRKPSSAPFDLDTMSKKQFPPLRHGSEFTSLPAKDLTQSAANRAVLQKSDDFPEDNMLPNLENGDLDDLLGADYIFAGMSDEEVSAYLVANKISSSGSSPVFDSLSPRRVTSSDRLSSFVSSDTEDTSDVDSFASFDYSLLHDLDKALDADSISLSDIASTASESKENIEAWEEMSPDTIAALIEEQNLYKRSVSPDKTRRRLSDSIDRRLAIGTYHDGTSYSVSPASPSVSPALRPIHEPTDGESPAEEAISPVPAEPHEGPPVDEVEAVFHV